MTLNLLFWIGIAAVCWLVYLLDRPARWQKEDRNREVRDRLNAVMAKPPYEF